MAYNYGGGCCTGGGLSSYGQGYGQPSYGGGYGGGYGGQSSYGGGYGGGYGQQCQPCPQQQPCQPAYSAPLPCSNPCPSQGQGLGSYGQSVSSETIDYRSLATNGVPPYGGAQTGYPQQSYGGQYAPTYSAPQYQQQSYGGGGGGPAQIDINDPHLNQQVEQIVASLTTVKRPMLRRQVITVPANCPPRVAYIHRRLPTPPPDIVERITVIKPPRDIVNLCIEKPCQPGPCYQQREICGKPRKPLIQPRVVSVQPRSNPCQSVTPAPPMQTPCPQSGGYGGYGGYGGSPVGGAPTYGGSTTGYPQYNNNGNYPC